VWIIGLFAQRRMVIVESIQIELGNT
jgi:hypothetical protein